MENNIENIISSTLKNPDLLEKISSAIKGNEGDLGKSLGDVVSLLTKEEANNEKSEGNKKEEESGSNEEKSPDLGQILELVSSFGKGVSKSSVINNVLTSLHKSVPLLIALKPFLSSSRRELIDLILKISKLSSIVSLAG